jgi:hypothetical protein
MAALIARVKNLLLSPRTEWDVIDDEETAPRKLVLTYVAPLAAIPTIAFVVGLSVLGFQGGRADPILLSASAGLFYVLTIGGVFAFAWLINWLAPRFGGQSSYQQAFKIAAYSLTAAMVAGIVTVIPALGVFALLGATYSLYLLFIGAPKLMRAPEKSALNYAIVSIVAAVAMALGVGLVGMAAAGPSGSLIPQMAQLPGLGDVATIGARGNAALPASAGELAPGGPAIAPDGDLRSAAPEKLAGLDRVSVGVERRGLPGKRTVQLDAEYRGRAGRQLSVQIVLSETIAEAIGFGGPATLEFDRETPEGFTRRRRIGDAVVAEEWNEASRTGSYGRLIDNRFYVRAAGGGGVRPQELREVVERFGAGTLALFEAER